MLFFYYFDLAHLCVYTQGHKIKGIVITRNEKSVLPVSIISLFIIPTLGTIYQMQFQTLDVKRIPVIGN